MHQKFQGNLFCRLFRYRPRAGRTPEEDFLTEAYAGILLLDKKAGAAVLSALFGVTISEQFELVTQAQYGGDRPDMEFRDPVNGVFVFQENKFGAEFQKGQLDRYFTRLFERGKEFPTKLLVSCTTMREAPLVHPDKNYTHYSWPQVFESVSTQVKQAAVEIRPIWQQFLGFLESKGMQPFSGIPQSALDALNEVEACRNQLWQLLDLIIDHLRSRYDCNVIPGSASKSFWSVSKPSLKFGAITFLPYIEYKADGIFFGLSLRKESTGLVNSESSVSELTKNFQPDVGGHLSQAVSAANLSDGFFEDVASDPQLNSIRGWYDQVLDPFVQKGMIQRRRA